MNLSEIFIRRPVMTTLLMVAILIFGWMGYRSLAVSDLPNMDLPTLQVTAVLPGASPETMASSVATPLEKQFSTIAGIDSMISSSVQGMTQITIQFVLDRNIDAAAQDVQAAISQAQGQLPTDMPSPPSYQKVNPAMQPILYFALTSRTLPLSTLNEYGETTMAQRISTLPGVAQVLIYGAQKYAVRVQVDPEKLANQKLGLDEVARAISAGNSNLPTGTLNGPSQAFTIQSTGQLNTAAEYRPLIVAYRNGAPVRLEQVAKVTNSVEADKVAAWYLEPKTATEDKSIVLAIQRQPGTNTVAVAQSVKDLVPIFEKQFPAAVNLRMLHDNSQFIEESVHDVKFTLVLTLALVVMVIFIFIRSLTATIIPSLALPMSIVGTFAMMYLLNFSLNNLTLMALTLSVGFVVDDAIVMLENVVRHKEMGKTAMQAALDGSREIGFTIISMTLSLAAVFIPIIFMSGIIGRFFREFAVTIGISVLVSGFVSLTLTPMMGRLFLHEHGTRHSRLYDFSERVWQAMVDGYGWFLRGVLRFHWVTVLVAVGLLVAMGYLFMIIPKGFLPSEDREMLFGQTEAIQGISYKAMFEHHQAIDQVLLKNAQYIKVGMSVAGGGRGMGASNGGFVFLHLTPKAERDLNIDQVLQKLRIELAEIPGINTYLQNPPSIPVGGRFAKGQYQYTLQGSDLQELYHYAAAPESELKRMPDLQDVSTDLQITNPQVTVDIDRDAASRYGLTSMQIEDNLYYAYGTRQISTILTPTNQYHVLMELEEQYQENPDALKLLYVRNGANQLVPLEAVARLVRTVGPLSVNHQGQLPAVTISYNLKPGASLGTTSTQIEEIARHVLGTSTITGSFQGTSQVFQQSMKNMTVLLIVSILVIYLVLGILYESFIHPITILTALPLAGFGALLTLLLFGEQLTIYAFVGIIMLVGLVKKNGIMMVDFAIQAQHEGKSPREAIYEACLVRFRPITMTTVAALMGALPIALGYGAGAEARRPLGLAVVGGLLFSQSLTLFVTPVFYLYMEKLRLAVRRLFRRSEPAPAAPAPHMVEVK